MQGHAGITLPLSEEILKMNGLIVCNKGGCNHHRCYSISADIKNISDYYSGWFLLLKNNIAS